MVVSVAAERSIRPKDEQEKNGWFANEIGVKSAEKVGFVIPDIAKA